MLDNLKGKPLEEQFRLAAEYAGVAPAVFDGIWRTESGRGKAMRSSAGARGHFQIMPEVQSSLERRAGRALNPDDFADGLTMASELIRENLQAADGDLVTALRMYHGGRDRRNWGPINAAYAGKVLGQDVGDGSGAGTVAGPAQSSPKVPQDVESILSRVDAGYRGDEHTPVLGQDQLDAMKNIGKQDKPVVDDFTKGLAELARSEGAATSADVAGENAQAVFERPEAAVQYAHSKAEVLSPQDEVSQQLVQDQMTQQQADKEFADGLDVLDKWGARYDSGPAAAMVWALQRDMEKDDNYDYISRIKEIETPDMTPEQIAIMRTAVSQEDEDFLRSRIGVQQYSDRVIQAHDAGTAGNLAWGAFGAVSDPVELAAGVAVSAVTGGLGLGATALARSGRPGMAVVAGMGEGGVGALASDGIIIGMGGHRSGEDIASDVAAGVLLGGLFNARPGALVKGRATGKDLVPTASEIADTVTADGRPLLPDFSNAAHTSADIGTSLQVAAAEARGRYLEQARAKLGDGATPEMLNEEALRLSHDGYRTWVQATLSDVSDTDKLFSSPEAWASGAPMEEPRIRDIVDRYGLQNRTDDVDDFRFLVDAIDRAEKIAERFPIDETKRKSLLETVDWQADSSTLLASQSAPAKAWALMMMENPEGAAGRMGTTAAIDHAQRFEWAVGSASREVGAARDLFAKEQGVGRLGRILHANEFNRNFNRAVSAERLERFQTGRSTTTSQAVREAADALDAAYGRNADMTIKARLPGWENIKSARGYFKRRWKGESLRAASPTRLAHIREALADELVVSAQMPPRLASEVSQQMLTRFQKNVTGAAGAGRRVGGTADVEDPLEDILNGMTGDVADAYKRKFGMTGQASLADRINLDMLRRFSDGEGGSFQLMDFIDHDQSRLLMKQARETSGYATLAKYNVRGPGGVKLYREALRTSGATGPEIEAFDRSITEFTGQGGAALGPSLLRNLRMLTSAIRLGSASINQMGAYADALHSLPGVQVAEAIGALPRLRKEAVAIAEGKSINNSIIGGMEVSMGSPVAASQYWEHGMGTLDTHDLMATGETAGMLSKLSRAASTATHIMSGQRLLIAAQTRGMAEQVTMKAWRFIAQGGEDAALRDMGLTPELQARLGAAIKELPGIAEFDERGVLSKFDPDVALGTAYERDVIALRNTVVRGTNQIMNHTFIGERGKWASNELMLFLMQFRTVSLVAQQKTLGRLVGVHGPGKTALLASAGMAFAMPLHAGRVALRASLLPDDEREEYIDRNMNLSVLARQSANYLTTVGLGGDAVDLSGAFLQGWAGDALPEWMKPTQGRGGGFRGDLIGGQLAPAVGVVEDVAAAVTGDLKKARGLLPGASLPYIQPFLLGGTERLEDVLEE